MKMLGLITTVSPYRGSFNPQPIYYPTPQHTYQHTYKLAYHNSITFFSISNLFNYRHYHAQTALHELVDDHVFLTSARCKMAQQSKLLGRNGVKKICEVCVQTCWCQSSQVFGRVCLCIRHECTECQACEGSLAWTCRPFQSQRICPEHCFASRPPCWRSKRSHTFSSSPKLASDWHEESDDCLNTFSWPVQCGSDFGHRSRGVTPCLLLYIFFCFTSLGLPLVYIVGLPLQCFVL